MPSCSPPRTEGEARFSMPSPTYLMLLCPFSIVGASFFGPPLLRWFVRLLCRRKGLGAGGLATVDQSLIRGSSRMTTRSSRGCLALRASVGQKPLQHEVKGSPDLRPAPRLVRRRDVECWRVWRRNGLGQQALGLLVGGGLGWGRGSRPRPG